MGFPQRSPEEASSAVFVGPDARLLPASYTCPRCRSRVAELPCECHTCGLTLISSPHLARSYHHLFPVQPFDEDSEVGGAGGGRGVLSGCRVRWVRWVWRGVNGVALGQLCAALRRGQAGAGGNREGSWGAGGGGYGGVWRGVNGVPLATLERPCHHTVTMPYDHVRCPRALCC